MLAHQFWYGFAVGGVWVYLVLHVIGKWIRGY